MSTLNELVFAVIVAIGAFFAPQLATVVLLALIYIKLDGRAQS